MKRPNITTITRRPAPHNWWDWYAAYMDARQQGGTPDEAVTAASRYMADVLHIQPL